MLVHEADDAAGECAAALAGTDDIGEHRSDLDAVELVRVADEDEPALGWNGGEQARVNGSAIIEVSSTTSRSRSSGLSAS